MGVRIKTISNEIKGAENVTQTHYRAHPSSKQPHDSRQTNKILELEWEALGRKLNKPVGNQSVDVERLLRLIKEKDEQIKNAESRIAELKRQLYSQQEKQRQAQPNKQGNKPSQHHNKQIKTKKNLNEKPQQKFMKPMEKRHQQKVT